ncbi:hypothetical protein CTAM01_17173 [Colletotrichum tamarilloi]|uniref:SAM-dependent methyltransferase n=1 Tax=Colletotrichum tamarilloi TaxID=1209934 RepID=A0ABQ9QGE1_9PEZI|nr:uncharacterized protein CTAM01_17173 [Colletotrichum tamarilloi]KAK1458535.1 hypothetical protein CTAM01_17173 [Colletotrichum tamarilloi]
MRTSDTTRWIGWYVRRWPRLDAIVDFCFASG